MTAEEKKYIYTPIPRFTSKVANLIEASMGQWSCSALISLKICREKSALLVWSDLEDGVSIGRLPNRIECSSKAEIILHMSRTIFCH